MKKISATLLSLLLFANVFSQTPSWQWGRDAGGINNDQGKAISTDANGNSYTTGRFSSTATFGSLSDTSYGGPDIYVSKYDTYGNCLWVKHGGSIDALDIYGDEGDGIDIDPAGNCYVTGNFKTQGTFGPFTLNSNGQREIFVVKYDANGNEIWARQPTGGQANNYSRAITVDAAGSSYITGYLGGGTNTFGAYTLNGPGAFVVKYDSSGTVIYATHLCTFGGIDAYGISNDASGNVYVTGYLQGTDSINHQAFTSTGDRDAFLIKVDATGNFQWLRQSRSIPGTTAYGEGVAVDMQGNPLFTGYFDNVIQFGTTTLSISNFNFGACFIAKFDSAGNFIWAHQSHTGMMGGQTQGFAMTTDVSSNAIITGEVYGGDTVAFGSHTIPDNGIAAFVALYDSSGNCRWALSSAGQNVGSFGYGVSTDNHGGYYITGYDKYPPIFGSDTLHVHGMEDIFVAKIGSALNATVSSTSIPCNSVCTGTADANAMGGTAPFTYLWSNSQTTPTLSALCAGTYFVTITDATSATVTDSVTITQLSTFQLNIGNDTSVCSPDTLTLNATTAGATYQWQNGSSTASIIAFQTGEYAVTVTSGGCMGVDSLHVTENPKPPASVSANQTVFCAGDSAQICANGGMASYIWNTGQSTMCITTQLAGNYYVTVVDNNGCSAASNQVGIVVNSPPPVTISVNGDTLTSYNAVTYQWFLNGNIIPGATSQTYIATQGGSYTVAVTDTNACGTVSNPVIISGIGEVTDNLRFAIYPNPATNQITISISDNLVGGKATITDITGREVAAAVLQTVNCKLQTVNFSPGIYFVRITKDEKQVVRKLVVE